MKRSHGGRIVPCLLRAILCSLALIAASLFATGDDLYVVAGMRTTGDIERVIKIPPGNSGTTFITSTRPYGVAFDPAGNLFVSDIDLQLILKVTPAGKKTTFTTAVSRPLGMAFDAAGNLFVADFVANAILKFTPAAKRSTFASGLAGPTGLAFDAAGNLFETDSTSGVINKFSPGGQKKLFAGGLSMPQGLAFDSAGNLFVAEFGPNVLKFTPKGSRSIFSSVFQRAFGLAFAPNGDLYVSDNAAGVVRILKPNGAASALPVNVQSPRFLAFGAGGGKLLNLSTRLRVQGGENALIGGFIATGSVPKKIVLRAIGPSLAKAGISGFLPDPRLELHDQTGAVIGSNDNWKINDQNHQTQEAAITSTTVAPKNDLESALIATLEPDEPYTAIVRGAGATTGVASVEVYDLDPTSDSRLANLSTRGFVENGENVMIGGFIFGSSSRAIVRAIGPSLSKAGVSNALANPTLELHDAQGNLLGSNDNWKTNDETGQSQEADIRATTVAPSNNLESALLLSLPAGAYTAIVSGKNGGTGVGLVEVFSLE